MQDKLNILNLTQYAISSWKFESCAANQFRKNCYIQLSLLLQVWAAPRECGQKVKAVCQSRFRRLISKIIAAIQHWAFHIETVISYLILGFMCVFYEVQPAPHQPSASLHLQMFSHCLALCPPICCGKENTFQELPHQNFNHLVGISGWNHYPVIWRQQILSSSCPGETWGDGSGRMGWWQGWDCASAIPGDGRVSGQYYRTVQIPSKGMG